MHKKEKIRKNKHLLCEILCLLPSTMYTVYTIEHTKSKIGYYSLPGNTGNSPLNGAFDVFFVHGIIYVRNKIDELSIEHLANCSRKYSIVTT